MAIVCATDFSELADRAATAAAALAARAGQPLWLVHVMSKDTLRALGEEVLQPMVERALAEEAERLRERGAEVRTAVLAGPLHDVLPQFAEQQHAWALVTGAPSREVPFMGTGGTLDRLAQRTSWPLLVVRDAVPFEAWAAGQRPLKVLLGVDRSTPTEAAEAWLQQLRQLGPMTLIAGHVFWPADEYERLGLPRPMGFMQLTPELQRALENEVADLVRPLRPDEPVQVRLEPALGRAADPLVELAEREGVDLLVVGTHHRRGVSRLWSVSHHAPRLAPMSVAVVPATAAPPVAEAPLPSFRRVLAATDFSEVANRAIPYAFAAVRPGGTVYLVHVGEPSLSEEQQRTLTQRLLELVPREAAREGKQGVPEVITGKDAADVLLRAAERFDADLVVIGSQGRGRLARVVLGSVAEKVMRESRRPALVVRPPDTLS